MFCQGSKAAVVLEEDAIEVGHEGAVEAVDNVASASAVDWAGREQCWVLGRTGEVFEELVADQGLVYAADAAIIVRERQDRNLCAH